MSVLLGCGCFYHEAGLTRCPVATQIVGDYNYMKNSGKWKAAADDLHDRWLEHYRRGFDEYHKEKAAAS